MTSNNDSQADSLSAVLGRIPSGVFILIAGNDSGQKTGMLASWVQQAGFEPPQVTVAVNKSRYLNEWLAEGSPVVLSQVAKGDGSLFKQFGKGFEPDADAFDGVDTSDGTNGLPLLQSALTSLEGTVASSIESGDHVIYLVTVTSTTVHQDLEQTEPFVHLRKNGLNY